MTDRDPFEYHDESVSFGMHKTGDVPKASLEDLERYQRSKDKTALKLEKDTTRPYVSPLSHATLPTLRLSSLSRDLTDPKPLLSPYASPATLRLSCDPPPLLRPYASNCFSCSLLKKKNSTQLNPNSLTLQSYNPTIL